ncbi:MAG: glycosyltransferase family 9 protein, partial [Acidobacteriota bacterium]|nr:glycosyltransferase family 9 protein [Acidobacteriota bacterium]
AAALRDAWPDARIDWLVDGRHREIVDLVTGVDRIIALEGRTIAGWAEVVRTLRQVRYDWAVDFQGLLKSAVLARASGATRVAGFSIWHLREKTARPFYTDTPPREDPLRRGKPWQEERLRRGTREEKHVIRRNLGLLRTLGIDDERIVFPLAPVDSVALDALRATLGSDRRFALINAGAAWPNKRWLPERFGAVAAFLLEVRDLPCFVLWGPGEGPLAQAVVEASQGAARLCPPTGVTDILALCRAAALMISGDTGPLHMATAAGTPTVSVFGPTDPARNGPWDPRDPAVSRFASCRCPYRRRCREADWCMADIPTSEVTAAVQQRLER